MSASHAKDEAPSQSNASTVASSSAPSKGSAASSVDTSQQQQQQPADKKKRPQAEKGTKPAKPKSFADHIAKMDSDDEDALLDAAIAVGNRCWAPKCKESVHIMSVICPHCRNKYCLYHSMPEVPRS
jgi:hypothetical protein